MMKLPCVCCVDEVINTVARAYFFLCIDVAFATENWISDNKQHGCVSLTSERYLWSWITKVRQANTYHIYGFPRRNYFHSTLFWDFGFKWKQNNTKHLQVNLVVDFCWLTQANEIEAFLSRKESPNNFKFGFSWSIFFVVISHSS